MNRFDMLVNRNKDKPVAYKFKTTNSPDKILGYLNICMEGNVALDASNLYPAVLDQALARLQKDRKIPVIVKSEKTRRVLLMSNLKKVYTIGSIPDDTFMAICYWDLNSKEMPKQIEIALTILKG